MSTTAVFVEIMIVGIQGFIWIAILFSSIFGIEPFNWIFAPDLPKWIGPSISIFLLAFSYTFGVILDRIADSPLFPNFPKKLLLKNKKIDDWYSSEHKERRFSVLIREGTLTPYLDYFRSRTRLLRTTSLNIILIIVSSMVFLSFHDINTTQYQINKIFLCLIIGGLSLLAITLFAWGWVELTYENRVSQLNKELDDIKTVETEE